MYERALHDANGYTPTAAAAQAAFHADVVREVSTVVARDKVVVVGMKTNPFVGRARKALEAAGIGHTYLEFGGYTSQWKRRLAIKMWSGWPTFPQVFVNGVLVGGCEDVEQALKTGDLQRWVQQGPPRA